MLRYEIADRVRPSLELQILETRNYHSGCESDSYLVIFGSFKCA